MYTASFEIDQFSNEFDWFYSNQVPRNGEWASMAYFKLEGLDPEDSGVKDLNDDSWYDIWDDCTDVMERFVGHKRSSTFRCLNDCYFAMAILRPSKREAEAEIKALCKDTLRALKEAKIPNVKVSINNIKKIEI